MTAVRIVDLAVPDEGAPTSTRAAHGWAEVAAECLRERVGHDDFLDPPESQLALYASQQHSRKQVLLALALAGVGSSTDVLGYAQLDLPILDNTHLAQIEIMVRLGARRQGIGTTLWNEVEARVRAAGRTVVSSWSIHGREAAAGEDAAVAPTGVGRLPADDIAVRFARRHGFVLEQTERQSTLPLPVEPAMLACLRADAESAAGRDYRLVRWRDATPERWLTSMAVLQARMSMDSPSAGLATGEEVWDEQRVRETDMEYSIGGAGYVLTAAEHVPSGELVAFTMIRQAPHQPEVAFQYNTLVRADHRGHRLGMLVKVDNLEQLTEVYPAVRRLHTWNAGENRHMLAINEALGFAVASVEGVWQRNLS
ncbi:MAG: GNAT family N-acetyltransferase [Georgenia sp.]